MKSFQFTLLAILAITFTSCNKQEKELSEAKTKMIKGYSDIVYNNYLDLYNVSQDMSEQIIGLIAQPNESNLEKAKTAWIEARKYYSQTEVFRFYGGPIDGDNGVEGQLNAWPLDESYIDYVAPVNNSATNIIGDTVNFPLLSKEIIKSLNEKSGETNISIGFHAIEFLLWGQDLSEGAGGGERTYTDFLPGMDCTNGQCGRRAIYLNSICELLMEDLQFLMNSWTVGAAYRVDFEAEKNLDVSFEKILAGMGKLSKGELAGERMFVAWDEKSKEDEQSCFSDNTHNDIYYNVLGVSNVYLGQYVKRDGSTINTSGISDVLALQNGDLNTEIRDLIESSLAACKAIQPPFDQEFLQEPGRTRIKTAIDLLRKQGDIIAKISAEFGFILDPSDI